MDRPAHRHQARAVRVPLGLGMVGGRGGQLPLAGAVAADDVQLVEAAALRRVGDRGAVGRPRRGAIVHPRRAGQRAHRAGRQVGHADLAAVEVGARREDVRHLGAVGRDRRLALVAVIVEVAVLGWPGAWARRRRCRPRRAWSCRRARRKSPGGRRPPRPGCRPRPASARDRRRSARATRGRRRRRRPWTRRATGAARCPPSTGRGRGRWSAAVPARRRCRAARRRMSRRPR